MKKHELNIKDVEEDLNKCVINPDAFKLADDITMKIKINSNKEVIKIKNKKQKQLTKTISKDKWCTNSTNELFWENKNEIEIARKEVGLNSLVLKVKECLSCGNKFESEGSHNRRCDDCREKN